MRYAWSVTLCASRVNPCGVECSQCLMLAGAASLGVAHGHYACGSLRELVRNQYAGLLMTYEVQCALCSDGEA